MGFDIEDLAESERVMFASFWVWRPAVEIIRSFGILDEERLELMEIQCVGATVTEPEARQIARRMRDDVLRDLPAEGRVRLDLSTTTEPDDLKIHYGDRANENYSATREWLEEFAAFCERCGGFNVA